MIISSKKELHSLVADLKESLSSTPPQVSIKTSRLRENFAQSLGYKSFNGLIGALPIEIRVTPGHDENFRSLIKQRHQVELPAIFNPLQALTQKNQSYSTHWNSDARCYPKELSANENYWYLTRDGWKPWKEIDFDEMRAELNIYEIVHAYSTGLGGAARSVWDASIASEEFEREAKNLKQQFGNMPDSSILYPRHVAS